MTNADKVRNSKNIWKVLNDSDELEYRCQNGVQIEYRYCGKYYINNWASCWQISQCDDKINSLQIEEIIPENNLSPLEEMIKNPGVEYQIEHSSCGQIRNVKWENNRLMIDCFNQNWQEILVGDFEKNFNPLTFKKYESLSDKVQQLSKNAESFGMYVQINPNNRVQVFLQDDCDAVALERLCERGLIVNDVHKSIIDNQIKYWTCVGEIKDLIDNQK